MPHFGFIAAFLCVAVVAAGCLYGSRLIPLNFFYNSNKAIIERRRSYGGADWRLDENRA